MSSVYVFVDDDDEVRVEPDEFGRIAIRLGDSASLRLRPAVAAELHAALGEALAEQDTDGAS